MSYYLRYVPDEKASVRQAWFADRLSRKSFLTRLRRLPPTWFKLSLFTRQLICGTVNISKSLILFFARNGHFNNYFTYCTRIRTGLLCQRITRFCNYKTTGGAKKRVFDFVSNSFDMMWYVISFPAKPRKHLRIQICSQN